VGTDSSPPSLHCWYASLDNPFPPCRFVPQVSLQLSILARFFAMPPKLSLTSTLPLTNSQYKIPQIGFGVYQSPPPTCVQSCVKAFSAGYRHIDTAIYYANENSVGRALKEAKIPRSEIFITSKILSPGNDVESTYKMIEESVKKLGGDNGYVDLFLIHSPNGGKESRRLMWLALEKARESGKVRDIGVSNYGIGHIEEIKEIGKVWPPVVNQIEVCVAVQSSSTARLYSRNAEF
jgi:diketogulonate reductase-like aldo/keto reductase